MNAQSKVIVLLALLGAAGFVMVGGDVLPENNAEAPREVHLGFASKATVNSDKADSLAARFESDVIRSSAPYQDCQRIVRGRQLRWQVAHFGDVEKLRIDCSYEERGELQL